MHNPLVIQKDNQFIFGCMEQGDAKCFSLPVVDSKLTSSKVSTVSDVLSSSMPQNIPQGKLVYHVS